MEFYHSLPIQIRFNDIDLAQHVNNSVYQEYFDLGRLNYFEKAMGKAMADSGLSMVIASCKVDFFKPLFLTDSTFVETRVDALGTKSLEMVQRIMHKGESEPRAVAVTVMVCFNYASQVSENIPDTWKEKIRRFEHRQVRDK